MGSAFLVSERVTLKAPHYLTFLVKDAILITWSESVRICVKIRAHRVAHIRTQSVQDCHSVHGYGTEKIVQLRPLKSGLWAHHHSVCSA